MNILKGQESEEKVPNLNIIRNLRIIIDKILKLYQKLCFVEVKS